MKSNKNIIIGVVVVVAALVLVSVFGDKKASEDKVIEQPTDSEVTAIMPENIPADIPMYPDSVLENVNDVTGDDGIRNITFSLLTEDSVSLVNSWYRSALNQGDWSMESDRNVGGYVLLKSSNDNISIFIQAANFEDGFVKITQRIQVK
jgi:hypothetical protein